jgi:hypothetical protein
VRLQYWVQVLIHSVKVAPEFHEVAKVASGWELKIGQA